jgi:hypothetical protein
MDIELTQLEMQFACLAALGRHDMARQKGRPDMKIGPQAAFTTDLVGILGELAVAKYFQVYPDISWSQETATGEADMIVNDARIDVKTTDLEGGHLIVRQEHKDHDIDCYILAIASLKRMPMVRLAGWAIPEEMFRDERLTDFGHAVSYAMTQEELNPLDVI